MSTKHTPGPWHLEPLQADHGASFAICGPGDYGILATIAPINADDEPDIHTAKREPYDEANACLILASPDLLETCKQSRHLLASDAFSEHIRKPVLALLNSAIAKAEGRKI